MSHNIGTFIVLAALFTLLLSLISIIVPIHQLGFKTRKRAVLYGILSFAAVIYGGALIEPTKVQTNQTAQITPLVQPPPVTSSQPLPTAAPEPVALITPAAQPQEKPMPENQQKFVEIMATIRQLAAKATNDMQRGGYLAQRNRLLCSLLKNMRITDWTGKVYEVGANGDGKGILQVEVAPDVYVRTSNNFISDMFDHTMIEPTSPVFQQAAALSEGQEVIFSGRFLPDPVKASGACQQETSLTLSGKLNDPAYLLYFDAIRPR